MVIDDQVREEIKEVLVGMFGSNTYEMIDYAFECNILDVNKCRIALIKRKYREARETNSCTVSKRIVAEQFCIAEKTVENVIYNSYYEPIKV